MDLRGRRRALVIGVGAFGPVAVDRQGRHVGLPYDDLEFSVDLAKDVSLLLGGYSGAGFDVSFLANPTQLRISQAWRKFKQDIDVDARVVHVISHGRATNVASRVEIVGRGGQSGDNSPGQWLEEAHPGC